MSHPNKRGTALINQYTIGIIIALMGFFLLAGTFGRWYVNADDNQAETICHDSVVARVRSTLDAKLTGTSIAQVNIAPLLCRTIDIEIKETDPEKIKAEFADLMSRCKHMFADGIYSNVFDSFVTLTGEERCFPCFTVVTNRISGAGRIPINQMEGYLSDNKGIRNYNKDVFIQDYLTNFRNIPGRRAVLDDITPTNTYVIYYSDPRYNSVLGNEGTKAAGYNAVYLSSANRVPQIPRTPVLGGLGEIGGRACTIVAGAEQQ